MSVRNVVKTIQDIMRKDTGVDGDAQRISQLCWMFFLKIIDDQDRELELMQDNYTSPIPTRFQWRAWAADPEGITGEELLAFINNGLFPALKDLYTTGPGGNRRRVVRDVFEDAYNYMKSGQLMRQVVNKINAIDFNNLAARQHFGDIYEQILNDLQSAGNAGEYYTPRAVTAFMADRIDPKPGETLFDPACGTGGFLTCAVRHMRQRYIKRLEDDAKMQASLRAVEKKHLPHMLCVTNMLLHNIEDPGFVRHDNTLARPYTSWERKDRVDIVLTNPPFGGKGRRRYREQLPPALSDQRDGGPVSGSDRSSSEAGRASCRGVARRHPFRRRGQDAAKGASDGRMQSSHHRSPAQFRIQTLRLHRNEPAVFRERRADERNLVLRASRSREPKGLFQNPAHPSGTSANLASTGGEGQNARTARRTNGPGR